MKTLKKRADFLYLRDGPKWITPSFILQTKPKRIHQKTKKTDQTPDKEADKAILEQTFEQAPCFGFTVSKKIGNAVKRNRAKRRLKEAVRYLKLEKAGKYSKSGYDYVFIARQDVLERDFKDLILDMRIAFQKVHQGRKSQTQHRAGTQKPDIKADLKKNGTE